METGTHTGPSCTGLQLLLHLQEPHSSPVAGGFMSLLCPEQWPRLVCDQVRVGAWSFRLQGDWWLLWDDSSCLWLEVWSGVPNPAPF